MQYILGLITISTTLNDFIQNVLLCYNNTEHTGHEAKLSFLYYSSNLHTGE